VFGCRVEFYLTEMRDNYKTWYLAFPRNLCDFLARKIKKSLFATHMNIFTLYLHNNTCRFRYFIEKFDREMLVIGLPFTNSKK